ncbi:MAG: sodium:calcium antiporter [Carbonactinosporaceae bacterium]
MIVAVSLLLVSFAVLLLGAFVFTNAVEWAGVRLNLGQGAVGSVLAAVATALPESVIPVVAIIGGDRTGQIAIGAIVGAPFLLGTVAMALVGLTVLGFRNRRPQGVRLRLHHGLTRRDLVVFMSFLSAALVLGLVHSTALNIAAAVVFVAAYGVYVWRTIAAGSGTAGEEEALGGLFFDPTKQDPPHNAQIVVQIAVGLALIIGGAQLFVAQIEWIAHRTGVAPLVLALVLAPLASELPEKVNSFLWAHEGKDALALGNITGAMVFQSMIPVAVGMAFTPWQLPVPAVAASACAVVGGAVCLLAVRRVGWFPPSYVLTWGALYGGAVYVILRLVRRAAVPSTP